VSLAEFEGKRRQEKAAYIKERLEKTTHQLRQLILAANSDYHSYSSFLKKGPPEPFYRIVNRHDHKKLRNLLTYSDTLSDIAETLLGAYFEDATNLQMNVVSHNFTREWSKFINLPPAR